MSFFGEGGLKDEGGMVDEVSGNEVPVGGTKEGVRDDIPANVSEGEFIFPADVVRFVGLDKLMQIRQDAKMGLKKMDAMGQMGNSDEATMDDDMPFSMADLVVVGGKGEPMELAGGGFIPVEDYTVVQDMIADRSDKAAAIDKDKAMSDMIADNTTKSAVIEKAEPEEEVQNFEHGGVPHKKLTFTDLMGGNEPILVLFVNEAGDKLMIPLVNGAPLFPIPPGYTQYIEPEIVDGEEVSPEDAETNAIIAAVNPPRREKEYDPMEGVDTTPVDWMNPELNGQEFLDLVKSKNTYGPLRTGVEAVFSFIPVVGWLGKMALRDSDKTILEAINARAKLGQFSTPDLQKYALSTATAVEKAGTSIIGKAIELAGSLFGKTEEETSAAIQLQNILDKTAGDKTSSNAVITNENGSVLVNPVLVDKLGNAITGDEGGQLEGEGNSTIPAERAAQVRGTNNPKLSGGVDPFAPIANTVLDFKNPNVAGDYSGDVVNSKYAGKDALPYYTSGVGVIDRTNTDFVNPENAKFRAGQLQDRRISGTLTNENKYKKQGKDTNRLEYGGPVSGGVELQDMLTGDSTILSKTSDSLRNIFGDTNPNLGTGYSLQPAATAKTEIATTQTTDTDLGKFSGSPRSSTTDLESTQENNKMGTLEKWFSTIVGGVKSAVSKIPGQSIDYAGNPIVTTDDDDGGSSSGVIQQPQAPGGGMGTGSGGQSSTVGQMTTPSYTQSTTSSGDNSSGSGTGQGFIDRSTASYVAPTPTPVKKETMDQKIKRIKSGGAGGFSKGGLASMPKTKKKTKTTNKRGLAARK